jgi:hypothetical protein
MLGTALFIGLSSARLQDSLVADLDRLAQAKDIASLAKYLSSDQGTGNPFSPISSGGGYGVGRFGWHALPLSEPEGPRRFVVFTTPMTSEDIGELLFEVSGGKLTYIPEDDRLGVKVLRNRFDIRFNTAKKLVWIKDLVTLSSESPGLKFLRFGPPYRMDSIKGGTHFNQAGGIVAMHLGTGRSQLDLHYHAKVDLPGYAAGISTNEFTLTNDYWWPMVGRWPAPYEMTVHAPRNWSVTGQGRLMSRSKDAGQMLWNYRMDLPVSYYSVTASPCKPVAQRIHGRTYTVWSNFIPRKRALLQGPIYAGIVEFYNSAFGTWPFPGYGAVVSKSYGDGALEAYSYATYGDSDIPGEDAHEPSHTLWGGVIPNTYLHSFWNESFANFSVGLYHRNAPIGSVTDRRVAFVSHPAANPAYEQVAVSKGSAFIGPSAGALGYGKGAELLAMLEDEIGTQAMERALQYWLKNHPVGTPGEWDEFEASVNKVTGKDFGWFFQEWLDRPGYAQFTLANARFEESKVRVDLAFQSPAYRMNMEVLVGYPDGRTDLRRLVVPAQSSVALELPLAQRPAWVSFDPYRRILRPFAADEQPLTIASAGKSLAPADKGQVAQLSGKILRLPSTNATQILTLMRKAGFEIQGNRVSFRNQTCDLRHGSAQAVIDLGGGQHCLIVLGNTSLGTEPGDADKAIFDGYGRFLAGTTPPKTSGSLVFSLAP